jgi:AP-3 complex subunit beta
LAFSTLYHNYNLFNILQDIEDEDEENKKPFYEDEDEAEEEQEKRAPTLDPDHRLLLRSAKPLLQSRNAAVRKPSL